jgi:hypothetical protein
MAGAKWSRDVDASVRREVWALASESLGVGELNVRGYGEGLSVDVPEAGGVVLMGSSSVPAILPHRRTWDGATRAAYCDATRVLKVD